MMRPQRDPGAELTPGQSTHTLITQRIKQGELHIWWANLRNFDSFVNTLHGILSPHEQSIVERFRFPRNRNNHIISLGILRTLLGSYAAQSPSHLKFTAGEHGKLELPEDSDEAAIDFSSSRSGDVVVYGIARDCPVGVDVEYVRPIPDYEGIALEYFSQSEVAALIALSKECQSNRFFDLWTRKEALLKAMGDGVRSGQAIRDAFPLDRTVSNSAGEPDPLQAATEWSVRSFAPTSGYVAAIAYRKHSMELSFRNVSAWFPGVSHISPGPARQRRDPF